MINDIFQHCKPNIHTSLYADDGALWLVHSDLTDALTQIQSALDTVLVWSHKWGLKVSTQKTKAMIFIRRRKLPLF